MRFVISGHFAGQYLDLLAHVSGDHFLGNDVGPQILFEILEGDALSLRGLFHVFHAFEVHALADLIQLFDHGGVAADAIVLAFLQEKLLIDEIAQQIFLPAREFLRGIGGRLLLQLRLHLVAASLQV